MKKKEWQEYYDLSDGDMIFLEKILMVFNGKIVRIKDLTNKC